MKLPLFQTSEAGFPLLIESHILANGHLGMISTEILEDRGTYYKVLEHRTVHFHGPVQEITYPDLSSIDLSEFFPENNVLASFITCAILVLG